MYTDTHCHILSNEYEDINQIINNLNKNNIKRIIINGYDYNSNIEVVKLCQKYDNVYGALGIHPDNIDENISESLKYIEENIQSKHIIAVGEIGLDYFHNKENKKAQCQLFEKLLELAEKYDKPVIIHNREATGDLLGILKKRHNKGIIHCFSGSYETAQEYIKLGFKLGINGIVTFKNSKLGETLVKLPISTLLMETDAPYLTPEPFRGTVNEPKYLGYIAKKLATIYNQDISAIALILEENFNELFDI